MLSTTVEPSASEISSFDSWVSRDYLNEYFRGLHEDEREVIRYFCDELRGAQRGPVLYFGCGPGLNHVFLSAPVQTLSLIHI